MPGGICWKTYLKLHLKDPELHWGILTLNPFRMPSEVRQRTTGVFCLESAFACSLISLGPSCAPVTIQLGAHGQSSGRPEWPRITLLFCWLSKEPRGPLPTKSLPSVPLDSPMQKLGPGRVGTGGWLPEAMKVATGDLGEVTSPVCPLTSKTPHSFPCLSLCSHYSFAWNPSTTAHLPIQIIFIL